MMSSSGFELEGTHAMDLATLQLKRYLALQRAKRKLRIISTWTNMTTKSAKSKEEKRKSLMRVSLKSENAF